MSSQAKIILGIKGLYVGLSTFAAYLSSTLIKERLIPEQLEVIGTVGSFFILVALLLTLIYWNKLSRVLSLFIIVTIVALCLLTFIQIQYVVKANVGPPNKAGVAENNFLIGFKLTEYGQQRGQTRLVDGEMLGENKPEEQYIEVLGYDQIPLWYGNSYKFMAVAYTLLYMLFVVGIVLAFGGTLREGGDAAIQAWAAQGSTEPAATEERPTQPESPATEAPDSSGNASPGQPG